MSKEYCKKELERVTSAHPIDDFDIMRIKLVTYAGETNWLTLNKESASALVEFLRDKFGEEL